MSVSSTPNTAYPPENILGMESILNRCMLCFTPDSLFVFENRQ